MSTARNEIGSFPRWWRGPPTQDRGASRHPRRKALGPHRQRTRRNPQKLKGSFV